METENKGWRDIGNLALSWLVIAVSGLVGLIVGININLYLGYFVASIVATFITLLIWNKGY